MVECESCGSEKYRTTEFFVCRDCGKLERKLDVDELSDEEVKKMPSKKFREKTSDGFLSLAKNNNRLLILFSLLERSRKPKDVSHIASIAGVTDREAKEQLVILEAFNLVQSTDDGWILNESDELKDIIHLDKKLHENITK